MADQQRILVTGASGYIATHTIVQLLQAGYQVRGTLRSLSKEARLRKIFSDQTGSDQNVEFVVADLLDDAGWESAMQDVDCVMHLASPIISSTAQDLDYYVKPAVEGTVRVLEAARAAGIKRVIQTSSVAAILNKTELSNNKIWTEKDWGEEDNPISFYYHSKVLAERAVWDFGQKHPEMQLTAINPGYVLGPIFDETFSGSLTLLTTLLNREFPIVPKLSFGLVDVRDVVSAHITAMTTPASIGKRFVCVSEDLWFHEMSEILNQEFGDQGIKAPTAVAPNFLMKLMATFDKSLTETLGTLGYRTRYDNSQIKEILHWQPISVRQSIIDTARSLMAFGLVKK